MKKEFILFFVIIIVVCSNFSEAQIFKNKDLQISKIEDHTWVIETTDMTTMYLIEGNNKALLIDTGTKCDSLNDIIKRITIKPLIVAISHAHGDHDGNVGFFNEIYLHPADTALLNKSFHGKKIFMTDGYVFKLGNRDIEVKHTPGHTPGSVVFIDIFTSSCYSGDSFGSGQLWLQLRPNTPYSTFIKSCDLMEGIMNKGITKIYCGHYPYAKKAFDKDYLQKIKQIAILINTGMIKDAEPYDIKEPIGCDNPMILKNGEAAIVFDPNQIPARK